MKQTYAILAILINISYVVSPCYGQLNFTVTKYNIEDGLPQQTISTIKKDRQGYMWFTTWNGICRFDGHSFVTYRMLPGDSNDLMTNRIDQIEIDNHNNLWLLDDDSFLYHFSPENIKFSRLQVQSAPIKNIFTLPDGDTWIFQTDGQLIRIIPNGKKFTCQRILHSPAQVQNVMSIIHDNDIIWIISNKCIHSFSKKTNKITLNFVSNDNFCCFRKWENKFLMGSSKGQLCIYNKKHNTYSIVKLNTNGKITKIRPYDPQHLVVIAENDGLFLMNNLKESIHYTSSNQLLSNQIQSVYDDDHQKHLWLTYKNSTMITRIDPFGTYCKHYPLKMQKYNDSQRHITQSHNGLLWVFSRYETLNYYNDKTDEFIPFSINPNSQGPKFIKTKKIYADNQDNLWISRQPKGLIKVSFKKELFNLSMPTIPNYLTTNNELRSIMEDADRNIWVGTRSGEIQVYDMNKKFIGFLNSTGILSSQPENFGAIYALLQDHKKNIWIGTRYEGLIKLIPRQRKLGYQLKYYKNKPDKPYSLSCNSIFAIKEDQQNRIWIATLGGGVNYIESEEDGNEKFINSNNLLLDYPSRFSRIKNICIDHSNNIWLATSSGILLCKWENNKLLYTPITRDSNKENSLSCDNVYDVCESSNHEIYAVTFGGGLDKLIGFDTHNNGIFKHYSAPQMISDIPLTMAEDIEGNLWIPSENGLYRLFTKNDSIEIYDNRFLPEGILLTDSKACRLSNNEMLFGTDKGLLSINPQKMRRDTYTSNLVITDIYINGEKTKSTYHSIPMVLTHKENSFSICYATLDMKFPNKIEYAYRLKGFDNWNYIKNNRKAIYTNIPKGNYVFQVKSTNSDGVWSNKIKEIPITILPSFWESIYGILLYIILFMLIVAITAYILFIIYKLRNRVYVEKQILDIKTKFFTDIIHELRTPFTLIVAPIDHMLTQKNLSPAIQQDLALVKRNTRHTLKIINQVLDLQKIQNESRLSVQRIEIGPFITHIIDNFQSIAIQRESEIILQTQDSPIFLWADPDKLESILFNLITNAFKYSPKGTVIHLSAKETDTNIIIQVSDQGYGISQEKQNNIFNRFECYVSSDIFKQQSTGIGLSLVKEQVELHKGKISLQSKVNEGSTFTIQFLKGKDHFPPETEFILSDYDERPLQTKENSLFLKDDYEIEEDCKDCNKNSILVVDDNKELLFFLHNILSEDFRVITASNGKEGLEKAIKYLPNMIVSDVVMPEMTGIEMIEKLQCNTTTCHIPIIFLSSKADVENQNQGLKLGVDDYITKPFSASYLTTKIWNIIKQRKRIQALYYSQLIQNEEKGNSHPEEKEELELLPQTDKELLDKIVSFINNHLDNPDLTVDSLVEEAGISRSALFKKIKTLIGISPMELIKNIRLKKAAELVKEGSCNFTQIAYKTGFNDSQYFSKCFKQIYGVTPTEYKRKNLS